MIMKNTKTKRWDCELGTASTKWLLILLTFHADTGTKIEQAIDEELERRGVDPSLFL